MDKTQADYLITGLNLLVTLPLGMSQAKAAALAGEMVNWFRHEANFGKEFEVESVTNGDRTWLTLKGITVPNPRIPDAISKAVRQIERYVERHLSDHP